MIETKDKTVYKKCAVPDIVRVHWIDPITDIKLKHIDTLPNSKCNDYDIKQCLITCVLLFNSMLKTYQNAIFFPSFFPTFLLYIYTTTVEKSNFSDNVSTNVHVIKNIRIPLILPSKRVQT